jgi:hypothetical protein
VVVLLSKLKVCEPHGLRLWESSEFLGKRTILATALPRVPKENILPISSYADFTSRQWEVDLMCLAALERIGFPSFQ